MSSPIHAGLAAGRWHELSLAEQLGNIGSEISRALRSKAAGNEPRMQGALERALELFELTMADPKLRHRLKEICRAREVVCDYFYGDNVYGTEPESLDRWFTAYAMAARIAAGRQ